MDNYSKNAVASATGAQARAEPIRLLKFLTGFGVGGTEKQTVELASRLSDGGFDVRFGCTKRWGPLVPVLEKRHIEIDQYHISRLYGYNTLRQQRKFAGDLRARNVQIMHSYNFHSNVFSVPAARVAGVPCVVASIRDLGKHLTSRQSLVHKWTCKMADHVLVNAGAIRDWLIDQGISEQKVSVIRNGVDISKYGARSDGAKLRRELDIPDNAPLVVMLSRLDAGKGIEYFLQAAAIIKEQCPDAFFLSVGDAFVRNDAAGKDIWKVDREYHKQLHQTVMRLGLGERLRFTGLRQDVPEILAAAAVSVLPSLSEGTSNTLLESLAARVPAVATRVGGTPEVIIDGQHGLLVPPRDPQAIADSVCLILKNPHIARELSENGRARVVEEFSFSEMVRRTSELYLDILGRKKAIQ